MVMCNERYKKAVESSKKKNGEKDQITRKDPFDFVYCEWGGRSYPLKKFMGDNRLEMHRCGLIELPHFPNVYSVFYDITSKELYGYNGFFDEGSTEIKLSEIPEGEEPLFVVRFDESAWTAHS